MMNFISSGLKYQPNLLISVKIVAFEIIKMQIFTKVVINHGIYKSDCTVQIHDNTNRCMI